jgi:sterol desaturase/sphingolipid hydroxylase (fatty acid hydroxylase superfamily)
MLTYFLAKFAVVIARLKDVEFVLHQMVFPQLLTFISLFVELIFVGYKKSALRKLLKFGRDVRIDCMVHALQFLRIFDLMGFAATLGAGYAIFKVMESYAAHIKKIDFGNSWLNLIFYFILFDLMCYVAHFLGHRNQRLFTLHAFHHSAEEMNILNNVRAHPMESVINGLIIGIPLLFLFDVKINEIFWIALMGKMHSDLYHSEIASDWGWIGRYILVSPAAHRVHHSENRLHFGKNLGNHLIIWDNIFGTAYHVKTEESSRLAFKLVDYLENSNTICGCFRNFFLYKGSKVIKIDQSSCVSSRDQPPADPR